MTVYNIKTFQSTYEDLYTIYSFCKMKYGLEYAYRIREKINKEVQSLNLFPYSKPNYFISNDVVFKKKIIDKRYLVIFSIFKNSIKVYYVYDGRRNILPNDLFNFS